jgi:hypothetical protein
MLSAVDPAAVDRALVALGLGIVIYVVVHFLAKVW